jgi:hypothetical protein
VREDQIDQAERRETLANDLKVLQQKQREQGSTFLDHYQDDTGGGRFAALGSPTVVGKAAVSKYPAAGAHQADPVGVEPRLGISVSDLESSMATLVSSSSIEATGAPAGAATSANVAPSSDAEPDDAGASFSENEGAA